MDFLLAAEQSKPTTFRTYDMTMRAADFSDDADGAAIPDASTQPRRPADGTADPAANSRTASAKTLFAGTLPNDADGWAPEVLLHAEPTGEYGIGLLRMELATPTFYENAPDDQHFLWLHDMGTVSQITWLAGRRFDYKLQSRSFCTYPAGADSTIEVRGPTFGMLLRVSAECLALAGSQMAAHGSALVEQMNGRDDDLFWIARILDAEAAAGHPNGTLFWSSVADALIRRLALHHLSTPAALPRGRLSQIDLRRLDAHVHENLSEPLDLDSLAAVVGCDRFHFAHRFRATVGVSPHRYVMRLRLERAREHIRAGVGSLAAIALDTGFTDQSHMCRWIRRVYNVRPTDLRG